MNSGRWNATIKTIYNKVDVGTLLKKNTSNRRSLEIGKEDVVVILWGLGLTDHVHRPTRFK